jgi:hypothetical protein
MPSDPTSNPEQINDGNKIRIIPILERKKNMRKKTLIRQLAVSVSEETWKKILESTNEAEVSISEWIRDAIEMKLELQNSVSTISKNRKEQR